MHKKIKLTLGDRLVSFCALALVIFGSLMIASAEMGNSAGDTSYLTSVIIRQLLYVILGIAVYVFLVNFRVLRLNKYIYYVAYGLMFLLLMSTRLFGEIGGAYAWITIGEAATIQPSEFAKVFLIALAAKMLNKDMHERNMRNLINYGILSLVFVLIVVFYQHDFGSGVVMFIICYCCAFIPAYKEYNSVHKWMLGLIFFALALIGALMTEPVNEFFKNHADSYMIGRFLAANDPFMYQYDIGYHVIMSLVSFANGGLIGLGYGNSIHKYMNFPNPSNDFILPVIVEELGFVGFVILIVLYALMLYPIIRGSLRCRRISGKIIMLGVFIYFVTHFILNVGGVGGLIPLTGVPLLMISSGGSSLMAALAALGLAQNELVTMKKAELNENNSGKI
ncbi:MAG: FtsW/RodA/SpoVE family cell cycle protein [Erysipelotrichaceae bacterium]|nr:FtsW/RodA/SpoVE family cell cycle protein [Erysipelotrichaceae bacterium]